MNTRVYKTNKTKVQKFDLDELYIADDESQVRQGDKLASHISDLQRQMEQRGQEVVIETVSSTASARSSMADIDGRLKRIYAMLLIGIA